MKTNVMILILLFILSPQSLRADVTDGLVGWWKLDETAGNALDSSGNGNTGTPNGTTILTSGCKKINCRQFNGSSDFIDLGTGTLGITAGSTGVTLSAFAYVGTYNSYAVMIGKSEAGNPWGGWQINTNGDSGNRFGSGTNVSGSWVSVTSLNTYSTNRWYHVVMTYDGSTSKLYVDGVLDNSSSSSGSIQYKNSAAAVYIGRNPATDTPVQYFNGYIDDVRIYNRALTQNEIRAVYLAGTPHVSVKGGGKISGMKVQ